MDLAKRSVDVKELGLHIWDQWADKNGKIEGCYGDMINTPVILNDAKNDTYIINASNYFINGNEITGRAYEGYGFENQTDFILWSLKMISHQDVS